MKFSELLVFIADDEWIKPIFHTGYHGLREKIFFRMTENNFPFLPY
jgi:hypothetical protein